MRLKRKQRMKRKQRPEQRLKERHIRNSRLLA